MARLNRSNADEVKYFYEQVVGWNSKEHDMGDYADYNMIIPNTDSPLTGICHKRGTNQNIPTQWLMYVRVQEVTESANLCTKLGGEIIDGPRLMG